MKHKAKSTKSQFSHPSRNGKWKIEIKKSPLVISCPSLYTLSQSTHQAIKRNPSTGVQGEEGGRQGRREARREKSGGDLDGRVESSEGSGRRREAEYEKGRIYSKKVKLER